MPRPPRPPAGQGGQPGQGGPPAPPGVPGKHMVLDTVSLTVETGGRKRAFSDGPRGGFVNRSQGRPPTTEPMPMSGWSAGRGCMGILANSAATNCEADRRNVPCPQSKGFRETNRDSRKRPFFGACLEAAVLQHPAQAAYRPLVPLMPSSLTTVQPSRPAASWSGCSWFSTVWPLSLVETRTCRAARLDVAITEGPHGSAVRQAMTVGRVSPVAVIEG